MSVVVEELEQRLTAVEKEMAIIRNCLLPRPGETDAERGARLLRKARSNQATISAGVARAFAEMGIAGEPIGAEKVQQMTLESGVDPEGTEFSRGIVEMREE